MKEIKTDDPQQIIDALPNRLPPIYEEGQKFSKEDETGLESLGSVWDPAYDKAGK